MQLIWFIVVGFLAGLIARAIMPGKQSMGLGLTTLLGVVGSFVGGFVSSLFSRQPVSLFRPSGIIGSIIGALIVLALYLAVSNRRSHAAV
ncbi:MAG TPA: GlsB/YeaQ/YmgE family stress response membrane protein [Polyangiaceae bacterium]|jgi:uncharacterized membrane protein YeaQ/YmgE (transglycosylase-associated protein family)|nr:GlsB/YeaQ/YmgE family stress response membrane protein [Polyangiaceae bacterium]